MDNDLPQPADEAAKSSSPKKQPSKASLVEQLLRRTKGASAAEIQEATGWKPHSVRAVLSGLRKKGHALIREERRSGELAYRISKAQASK